MRDDPCNGHTKSGSRCVCRPGSLCQCSRCGRRARCRGCVVSYTVGQITHVHPVDTPPSPALAQLILDDLKATLLDDTVSRLSKQGTNSEHCFPIRSFIVFRCNTGSASEAQRSRQVPGSRCRPLLPCEPPMFARHCHRPSSRKLKGKQCFALHRKYVSAHRVR